MCRSVEKHPVIWMYIKPNTFRPPVNLCEMSTTKSETLKIIEENKLQIARTIMEITVIATWGNGFEMINQCFELCNTRFLINDETNNEWTFYQWNVCDYSTDEPKLLCSVNILQFTHRHELSWTLMLLCVWTFHPKMCFLNILLITI